MCRGKKSCELLMDQSSWDQRSPLPSPPVFDKYLTLFEEAVMAFSNNNKGESLSILSKINNQKMLDWFIEHAQISGKNRTRQINYQETPSILNNDRKDRSPKKLEKDVFARDGYRCRYCSIRLVSNDVLVAFSKSLNDPAFSIGRTNLSKHGIIHIFKPVADHVLPWRLGGDTTMDNLVTSCGGCNYGKDRFSLKEIGIIDPRSRPIQKDDWDGLLYLLPKIK